MLIGLFRKAKERGTGQGRFEEMLGAGGMATNTVNADNRLRKIYNPVNIASVRRFDDARAEGARVLEQQPENRGDGLSRIALIRAAANDLD
jgi:hypothetical protein